MRTAIIVCVVMASACGAAAVDRIDRYLDEHAWVYLTADVIALGTVVDRSLSRMDTTGAPGLTTPVIRLRMSVEEYAKGAGPDTIEFEPGAAGVLAPDFYEAERVIAFLRWRDANLYDTSSRRRLVASTEECKLAVDRDSRVAALGVPVERFLARIRKRLRGRSPSALLKRAEAVVVGEVTDRRIGRRRDVLPPEKRNVFVVVDVWGALKGAAPGDTLLVVPPPEPDEYTPIYEEERVLLFLSPIPGARGFFEIEGGADGKYRLDDYTTASVLSQIGWRRVLVEPADTSAKPSAGNGD